MTDMYLLLVVAGEKVALSSDKVEFVVEMDAITPVPRVAPHIAGLFALRSRVLTVVDTRAALGLPRSPLAEGQEAVIVAFDGQPYALMVDRVEDVIRAEAPDPIDLLLDPNWRRAALGIVTHEGEARLLLDPAVLIAGPNLARAA